MVFLGETVVQLAYSAYIYVNIMCMHACKLLTGFFWYMILFEILIGQKGSSIQVMEPEVALYWRKLCRHLQMEAQVWTLMEIATISLSFLTDDLLSKYT